MPGLISKKAPTGNTKLLGDGPNAVSESTVSDIDLTELSLTELRGENSACIVCQSELTEYFLQDSLSLPQNSVSSLFRQSALETVFRYRFLMTVNAKKLHIPLWTTVSPHDGFSAPLAHPHGSNPLPRGPGDRKNSFSLERMKIARGNKRNNLNGKNGAKFAVFVADFRRFSHPGGADFRRQPQIFAENSRKPQTFAETRLSHLVCPKKIAFPHARIFILAWNFHSRFEIFILDWKFQSQALFFCGQRGARNEKTILDWKFHSVLKAWYFQYRLSRLNFFNPGALWVFKALQNWKRLASWTHLTLVCVCAKGH